MNTDKFLFTKLHPIFFLLFLITSFSNAQISIKAVGDIMLGSVTPKTVLPADSGKIFVKEISKYLKDADIVFGNFEGTFILDHFKPKKCSESSRATERCFEFGMPDYLSTIISKLHFNVLNLDNNHSNDYGWKGYNFTQNKLKELNIYFAAKKKPVHISIKGKKVIIIPFGFSETSFLISNIIKAKQIVSKLKTNNNIIIVSFHGGAEGKNALHVPDSTEIMYGENRGNVKEFAHSVIDAGADLVLGHGPHILRALELYKDRLIAYSLGNFLTYGNMNIKGVSGIAGILEIKLDEKNGKFQSGYFISTKQISKGYPVIDESKEAIKLLKELTETDFPKTNLVIKSSGLIIKKPPSGGL